VLLQCWVNHNSRVVVPTGDFLKAVGGVFEEADLVEEWCEARLGLDPTAAMAECVAWLREPSVHGDVTRQRDARGGTTPQRHPAADAQAPALALATSPYALQWVNMALPRGRACKGVSPAPSAVSRGTGVTGTAGR
jgi:hypothetical protein